MTGPQPGERRPSVLVTGGATGIGRAIVEAFVADGASVAFTYHASQMEADTLAGELGSDKCIAIAADFTNERQAALAVAQANEAFGPADVLVANAGGLIAPLRRPYGN